MPTPTKDFGRGGASSPGQGKEDFDAGLPNGPLTLVIVVSLVTTGIRGVRWLDLSHRLRLARTGQLKPRERFARGGKNTRERKIKGQRERVRETRQSPIEDNLLPWGFGARFSRSSTENQKNKNTELPMNRGSPA